jgi:hypothetical protein
MRIEEMQIDSSKRIVDLGLLEDEEAAALGNLVLVESLLRQLSNEGQDRSIDMPVCLQDACQRGADVLFDAYKVLRERMLQFVTKEAKEAANLEAEGSGEKKRSVSEPKNQKPE